MCVIRHILSPFSRRPFGPADYYYDKKRDTRWIQDKVQSSTDDDVIQLQDVNMYNLHKKFHSSILAQTLCENN